MTEGVGSPKEPRVFTLTVTPEGCTEAGFTARVSVTRDRAVATELSLRISPESTALPTALAELDFAALTRAAAALSRGDFNLAVRPQEPPDDGTDDATAPTVDGLHPKPEPLPATAGGAPGRRRSSAVPGAGSGSTGLPADLAVVYWRLGSATKVAEHYDVTPQTARAWLKTLRGEGKVRDPWGRRGRRRSDT
jgi:hypothetical protein